jgi:CheY-like chemotaxis protein
MQGETVVQMETGLHGKLEDLGLDEILQIVGVSRRTGILTLKSRGREAVLQFRDGLLVRVTSTGFQQSLGELLVRNGAATPEMVDQALAIQQQEQFCERIGTILHNRFHVDLQLIETTVREQISNVLMTLFAWTEGSFDCSQREVETVDAAYLDPVQLILELGDNAPDLLVAEGVRLQHDLGADEGQKPVQETLQPCLQTPEPALPPLVIVDDDSVMAEALAAGLVPWFDTTTLTRSEEALVKIDSLYRTCSSPVVLVDLIMPKMDGTGVLGGLELIRLLHKNFRTITIIAISDFHHADAVQEIYDLGYPCFIKPRRGDIKGELFASFMKHLKVHLHLNG